jgi:hypothetical protein
MKRRSHGAAPNAREWPVADRAPGSAVEPFSQLAKVIAHRFSAHGAKLEIAAGSESNVSSKALSFVTVNRCCSRSLR